MKLLRYVLRMPFIALALIALALAGGNVYSKDQVHVKPQGPTSQQGELSPAAVDEDLRSMAGSFAGNLQTTTRSLSGFQGFNPDPMFDRSEFSTEIRLTF